MQATWMPVSRHSFLTPYFSARRMGHCRHIEISQIMKLIGSVPLVLINFQHSSRAPTYQRRKPMTRSKKRNPILPTWCPYMAAPWYRPLFFIHRCIFPLVRFLRLWPLLVILMHTGRCFICRVLCILDLILPTSIVTSPFTSYLMHARSNLTFWISISNPLRIVQLIGSWSLVESTAAPNHQGKVWIFIRPN